MLFCLCLFVSCSCSNVGVEEKVNNRFVHHWIDGISIWEDKKLSVVCYNFMTNQYSCVENRVIGGVE